MPKPKKVNKITCDGIKSVSFDGKPMIESNTKGVFYLPLGTKKNRVALVMVLNNVDQAEPIIKESICAEPKQRKFVN